LHHLEHQHGATTPSRNHKNGSSKKTVLTTETRLALDIPRDRDGSFEPQLIAKHQRRLPGFDDKVVSLYAKRVTGQGNPGGSDRTLWVGGIARPDFHHHR
jgi:transposase-like protein